VDGATTAGAHEHMPRRRRWQVGSSVLSAAEREIIFTLIGSPNQVEAITANFENRTPKFTDAR
jgi:hypothetical protein